MSDPAVLSLMGDEGLQFTDSKHHSTIAMAGGDDLDDIDDDEINNIDDDTANLLSDSGQKSSSSDKKTKWNCFSFDFYSRYFDVDTDDVTSRLLWSVFPGGKTGAFLRSKIRPNPDLYGPFWVCVTLVFSVAISGNLASYLTDQGPSKRRWHYDFHQVTLAATAVFTYACLVPALLYSVLWWASSGSKSLPFVQLICVYGYSLTIYVPASLLWLIQYTYVQWALVFLTAGLSGAVLTLALYPAIKEASSNRGATFAFVIIFAILLLHLLLASGFMLYFFHNSNTAVEKTVVSSTSPLPDIVKRENETPKLLDKVKDLKSEATATIVEEEKKTTNSSSSVPKKKKKK